jgi:hypothetical protein
MASKSFIDSHQRTCTAIPTQSAPDEQPSSSISINQHQSTEGSNFAIINWTLSTRGVSPVAERSVATKAARVTDWDGEEGAGWSENVDSSSSSDLERALQMA